MINVEAIKQEIISRIEGSWTCDPWDLVTGAFEYDILLSMGEAGEIIQDPYTALFYLP